MKNKKVIVLSIIATLFMGGCGDKSAENRQTLHEEPADETILTINNKAESTKSEDVDDEKVANIDNNSTDIDRDKNTTVDNHLNIPPELLKSTRKRVTPKPMRNMPPELVGLKREVDTNKTEVISKGPDGIELPDEAEPEKLSIPPELLESETK